MGNKSCNHFLNTKNSNGEQVSNMGNRTSMHSFNFRKQQQHIDTSAKATAVKIKP
jgi:hypothetical protein